jgi:hypothetical protein
MFCGATAHAVHTDSTDLHSVGVSGHFVGTGPPTGQIVSMMLHCVSPPGHSVCNSGHVVSAAGHTVSPPLQRVRVSGQSVSTAGHFVLTAGQRVVAAVQVVD